MPPAGERRSGPGRLANAGAPPSPSRPVAGGEDRLAGAVAERQGEGVVAAPARRQGGAGVFGEDADADIGPVLDQAQGGEAGRGPGGADVREVALDGVRVAQRAVEAGQVAGGDEQARGQREKRPGLQQRNRAFKRESGRPKVLAYQFVGADQIHDDGSDREVMRRKHLKEGASNFESSAAELELGLDAELSTQLLNCVTRLFRRYTHLTPEPETPCGI